MSSTTSKAPESSSDSKDLGQQQTPGDETSDQSKNGGGESDRIEGGAVEAAHGEGGDVDRIEGGAAEEARGGGGDEAEDEEGECGFCLFMKGGGCKDTFTEWEKCVEEADKTQEDVVEKCFQVTANLKKCMEAHADYYEPILAAEKAAEQQVTQEMQREADEQSANSDSIASSEISEQQVKL